MAGFVASERNASSSRLRLSSLRASKNSTSSMRVDRTQGAAQADLAMCRGQLVMVDEAFLASTASLDALRQQPVEADAKLLLVGDHYQLVPSPGGSVRKPMASVLSISHALPLTHPRDDALACLRRSGTPRTLATSS